MQSWIEKVKYKADIGSIKYNVCVQDSTMFRFSSSRVSLPEIQLVLLLANWLYDLRGMLLYLSLPQFPHLRNGDNNCLLLHRLL